MEDMVDYDYFLVFSVLRFVEENVCGFGGSCGKVDERLVILIRILIEGF